MASKSRYPYYPADVDLSTRESARRYFESLRDRTPLERGAFVGAGAQACAFRNVQLCGHDHPELEGRDFVAKVSRIPERRDSSDRFAEIFELQRKMKAAGIDMGQYLCTCYVESPSYLPPQWASDQYCMNLRANNRRQPVLPDGELPVTYMTYDGQPFIHWLNTKPLMWHALGTLQNVCETMVALAKDGYIHHDIRLENVVIDDAYRAKLVDLDSVGRAPDDPWTGFCELQFYLLINLVLLFYRVDLVERVKLPFAAPGDFNFHTCMSLIKSMYPTISENTRTVDVTFIAGTERLVTPFAVTATGDELAEAGAIVLLSLGVTVPRHATVRFRDARGMSLAKKQEYMPLIFIGNAEIRVEIVAQCRGCGYDNAPGARVCDICERPIGDPGPPSVEHGGSKKRRSRSRKSSRRSRSRKSSRRSEARKRSRRGGR